VLDNLFRNHYVERLKVAEIQCRIALIENQFLGQNVASFEGFGSPAVQRQILRFKKSAHCKALERDLEKELASEHRMRFEECLPITRSEGVRMISGWCASEELYIADVRKSLGLGTWLKETEDKLVDWLFERYEPRAIDSPVIEALGRLRDEVTARIVNQAGARSELERRISVLSGNLEQHILRIRASPFLGPVSVAESDSWDIPDDLADSLHDLNATKAELISAEGQLVSLDRAWMERISRLTDTLKSEKP
jgi:hypothetical protein